MRELVRGLCFVPGRARGVLTRRIAPDTIALADHAALRGAHGWPSGCVLIDGAPFSHAAIGLLSRGVPTVMISREQSARLPEGLTITLDAATGRIFEGAVADGMLASPPTPISEPVVTADREVVELRASVRDAAGARRAREQGAAAIGLVRTEFLQPERHRQPDAGFYRDQFRAICQAAGPLSVTVRLLDLAADKRPSWASALPAYGPLGLQGVRLYSREPVAGVVRAQLAAISQLAAERSLRILLPYVADPEEFLRWRRVVENAVAQRAAIGAMVETPAAALMTEELMEVADFLALGTNDLMQCLYAADRDDPELRPYLSPYAPAIYRLLQNVARNSPDNVARIQVCGILPQFPGIMSALIGLGYRSFSVDVAHLPYLARSIRQLSLSEGRRLAAAVCGCGRTAEVKSLLWGDSE